MFHEESLMNSWQTIVRLATALLVASAVAFAQSPSPAAAQPQTTETILRAADINDHVFPATVFFRGQTTTSQLDNSGGVRYADGFMVLAALVDNAGYATQVRVKYQAYLIVEVPIVIGGQTLNPGAYGCGFVENNKFVVMDLGANDLLTVTSTRDTDIQRPIPLQFVAAEVAGGYRLYHGRDFVEFRRVK
jgi:hypothetical protein